MGNNSSLDHCCNPSNGSTQNVVNDSQRSIPVSLSARESNDGMIWTKSPLKSPLSQERSSRNYQDDDAPELQPLKLRTAKEAQAEAFLGRAPSANTISNQQDEDDMRPSFTRLARGLDRKVTRLLHEFAAVDASMSIKSLLDDMGDDAYPYMTTNSDFGMTPLHTAARRGALESAKHLIAAGAELEMLTMDGQSVVDLASYGRNRDFIEAIPGLYELQMRRNGGAGVQDSMGSSNMPADLRKSLTR